MKPSIKARSARAMISERVSGESRRNDIERSVIPTCAGIQYVFLIAVKKKAVEQAEFPPARE